MGIFTNSQKLIQQLTDRANSMKGISSGITGRVNDEIQRARASGTGSYIRTSQSSSTVTYSKVIDSNGKVTENKSSTSTLQASPASPASQSYQNRSNIIQDERAGNRR